MTGFDEREKGFEAKYRLDQEARFKISARRNKLLGLWAAERMGMSGASAEEYAKEVVVADFDKPGDADVLEKVLDDFTEKGLGITDTQVREQMDKLTETARQQIMKESTSGDGG
ncbi:MAG: DUF1476 domain-containing protein [Proteobacteria bacterium]|nr:DUF1476 domain-containing protein [Pseudomonadota bacterium]